MADATRRWARATRRKSSTGAAAELFTPRPYGGVATSVVKLALPSRAARLPVSAQVSDIASLGRPMKPLATGPVPSGSGGAQPIGATGSALSKSLAWRREDLANAEGDRCRASLTKVPHALLGLIGGWPVTSGYPPKSGRGLVDPMEPLPAPS